MGGIICLGIIFIICFMYSVFAYYNIDEPQAKGFALGISCGYFCGIAFALLLIMKSWIEGI